MSHVRWSEVRDRHIAAVGADKVEAGKAHLLGAGVGAPSGRYVAALGGLLGDRRELRRGVVQGRLTRHAGLAVPTTWWRVDGREATSRPGNDRGPRVPMFRTLTRQRPREGRVHVGLGASCDGRVPYNRRTMSPEV